MFVGHYGLSFVAKRAEPSVPLWVLFLSVQLLDVIWAPLILLGIEQARIVPGITEANALDFTFYPYTHSLLGAAVWSIVAGGVYLALAKPARRAAALVVAAAVFSHWPLDFLMHRPDLPLYDNAAKVGLGLWNVRAIAYAVEVLTLLIGLRIFLAWRRGPMLGTVIFAILLIVLQGYVYYGPTPQSTSAAAGSGLAGYLFITAAIWWLQDRRTPQERA